MQSQHLPMKTIIPLWNPSPIRGANERRRSRIDVGDVGTFTTLGGFRVAFNILMDEGTNRLCGYRPPPNFSHFVPPPEESNLNWTIQDDGQVINLDTCGAIGWETPYPTGLSSGLSRGFRQNFYKSPRT